MSYSYIKSVFPNFEQKTFNKEIKIDIEPEKTKEEFKNTRAEPIQGYEFYDLKSSKDMSQNNLKFYNLPSPKEYLITDLPTTKGTPLLPQQIQQQASFSIENFDVGNGVSSGSNGGVSTCDDYIKHISECNKCKSVLMKQLGIENDRIRNEEIMEVISYIVFALFILLLIDSFKK
jgi:hypothetical protein